MVFVNMVVFVKVVLGGVENMSPTGPTGRCLDLIILCLSDIGILCAIGSKFGGGGLSYIGTSIGRPPLGGCMFVGLSSGCLSLAVRM